MNFKVLDPRDYEWRVPRLSEPTEIGCYSVDINGKFCDDRHQRKFVALPPTPYVHFDLSVGYTQALGKEIQDMHSKREEKVLFRWLLNHQETVRQNFPSRNNNRSGVDFVCTRKELETVCSTVYEKHDDWLICATRYQSVIYMSQYQTKAKAEMIASMTDRDFLMTSWGFKFEQFVTSDAPGSRPDPFVPKPQGDFHVVLKGQLDNHTILFKAEMDGEDPAHCCRDHASMGRYVEMKTSRIIEGDRQYRNFCRFKLLRWWLQSFLAGVPKIVCGFRDDDGIVRFLKEFRVADIPRMVQRDQWSPAACLNFLSFFLDHVNKCVTKDDPNVVYVFRWKPRQDITCKEVSLHPEDRFVPDWYVGNVHF